MFSIFAVLVMAVAALFCSSVHAGRAIEQWTSPLHAYDLHAVSPSRFQIQDDAIARGRKVAMFTVMPGDRFGNTTGERSEVILGTWRATSPFRVLGNEGTEYFRISVKLDENWKAPERNVQGYSWGIFFQLHGPDDYGAPPAVALHAEDKFALFVLGGDMDKKVGGRRFLTRPDLNVGKWINFVVAVKWASDASGAIAVFRRDEGETDWEQVADIKALATLQFAGAQPPKPHYWKAGFYRSESAHTNTLWLRPILRTTSFEDATRR